MALAVASGVNILSKYGSPLAEVLFAPRTYYWLAAGAIDAEVGLLVALAVTLRRLSRPLRQALLGPTPPPSSRP